MNLKIPPSLLHATSLVRDGKLAEATKAIQRALRGDTAAPPAADTAEAVTIEGYARVVEADTRERAQGTFGTRRHASAAGACAYKIYVPGAYYGQALPLLIMLHGCQQGPDDFAAATRMNVLAEEHGFVVAYPEQTGNANASKCWNWFSGDHQQRERGEPALIAGITLEILRAYGLDAKRVYVAGLSAGGAMAAIMGRTYPDVYAAIGIHSGLAYAAARDVPSAFAAMRGERAAPGARGKRDDAPSRRVPTIVFHGDSDTTVHPSNGDEVIAQASPASGARDTGFTAFRQTQERGNASGRAYTRTIYRDTSGKPVIEQWVVHGAAHAWSGGSAEGSFGDPGGPDASREMLHFFLQHQNT